MKTIYSLLYVNLNAALEERVCIGLVMTNGEEYFYENSAKKLKYISQLLSEEKKSFIKRYLKSLIVVNCFQIIVLLSCSYTTSLKAFVNSVLRGFIR